MRSKTKIAAIISITIIITSTHKLLFIWAAAKIPPSLKIPSGQFSLANISRTLSVCQALMQHWWNHKQGTDLVLEWLVFQ